MAETYLEDTITLVYIRGMQCINCGSILGEASNEARATARQKTDRHDEEVQAALKRAGEKRQGRSAQKNPHSPWRVPGVTVCDSGDEL